MHVARIEEELDDGERGGRQDQMAERPVAAERQQPQTVAERIDEQVREPKVGIERPIKVARSTPTSIREPLRAAVTIPTRRPARNPSPGS